MMSANLSPPASRMPVLFLSHGSPMAAVENGEQSQFWQRLGQQIRSLPGLRSILIVSGHWETSPSLALTATGGSLATIHDFYGFPSALYAVQYNPRGAPAAAGRAMELLKASGFSASPNRSRGLDHGSWVPLKWMLPEANVPVVQLSLLEGGSMRDHLRIGEALQPLRDEGVLIIGSGAAVHNLRDIGQYYGTKKVPSYVPKFDSDLEKALTGPAEGTTRNDGLLGLQNNPKLRDAHPTLEHLLPLYVAAGAAGVDTAKKIYHELVWSISNGSYVFGGSQLESC